MSLILKNQKFRTTKPFSNIIAFDWHDGLVKGLAASALTDDVYFFTLLDCDETLDRRVFAFYGIERGLHDDCEQALSEIENPRHPIWCPSVIPGQIDFSKWSVRDRNRLTAVVAASPLLDLVYGQRSIGPDDQVDLTEWSFDRPKSHDWIEYFFGKSDE